MTRDSGPVLAGGNQPLTSQRHARNVFTLSGHGVLPFIWIAALLAVALLALYAPSLRYALISNDLVLINEQFQAPLSRVFAISGEKHFLPIELLIVHVQSNTVGADPFLYHVVALLLGLISAVLVVAVAWQLSGRIAIAALAGLIFVTYGNSWEPYLRAVAGSAYTSGTALTLAGFGLYIRAHDRQLSAAQRRLAYIGFVIALILAPLAYELGITLIAGCALYRFFILERGIGFSRQALVARARDWLRDLGLPALLVLVWFGFKAWLGLETQAPGLTATRDTLNTLVQNVSLGLAQAFVPGVGPALFEPLWSAIGPLPLLLIELAVIGVVVWRGTPVMRVMALWAALMLVTMVAGFGRAESRQLYLMTAPASILWASLLWALVRPTQRLLDRLRARADIAQILRFVPTAVLALILVLAGSRYAVAQREGWQATAGHAATLFRQIEEFAQDNPSATDLYLIDLPSRGFLPSGEGLPIIPTYSAAGQVGLWLPGRFETVIPVVTGNDRSDLRELARRFSEVEEEMRRPEALALIYTGKGTSGRLSEWPSPPEPADLTKLKGRPEAAIEKIAAVAFEEVLQPGRRTPSIPQGDLITVSGRASAVDGGRAGGVFVVVDDRLHVWAAESGNQIERAPSTASATGPPLSFEAAIPGGALAPGEHTLSLMVLTPDLRSYQETKPITIEVVPAESAESQ